MLSLSFADWNRDPIILDPWNDLPTADIMCWFIQSLPGKYLGPPKSLVQMIATALAQTDVTLRQQVCALLMDLPHIVHYCHDSWLTRHKMTFDKCARMTLLV